MESRNLKDVININNLHIKPELPTVGTGFVLVPGNPCDGESLISHIVELPAIADQICMNQVRENCGKAYRFEGLYAKLPRSRLQRSRVPIGLGVTSRALYRPSIAYHRPVKAPVGASLLANEAVAGKPAWFASKLAPTPERATGYTLLDFGQFFSESDERVQLHARIVTSPVYAKVLLEILRGSLAQCERRFGPIPWQNAPGGLA